MEKCTLNRPCQHEEKWMKSQDSEIVNTVDCRTSVHNSNSGDSKTNENLHVDCTVQLNENKVKLHVNNVDIVALADSGADVSCIRLDVIDQMKPALPRPFEPSPIYSMSGFSGENAQVEGCVSLNVKIGKLQTKHKSLEEEKNVSLPW